MKEIEKYILLRSVHLGFIKETFGRGALIEYDPNERTLNIDGRSFDNWRDIEILKRQSRKNADNPMIVDFSQDIYNKIIDGVDPQEPPTPKMKREGMEIIRSDADEQEMIDIRDTQVSRINREEREADKRRVENEGMEIIRADEGVEERIARLKQASPTDMNARAERVRLMREQKPKMEIIRDDSLGTLAGGSPLNAGQKFSGRRAEESPEEIREKAEARKREADEKRIKAGIAPEDHDVDEVISAPVTSGSADDKDAEIARLKAEIEQESQPEPEPEPDPRDEEIARLRAELEKVRSHKSPKRVPVLDNEGSE